VEGPTPSEGDLTNGVVHSRFQVGKIPAAEGLTSSGRNPSSGIVHSHSEWEKIPVAEGPTPSGGNSISGTPIPPSGGNLSSGVVPSGGNPISGTSSLEGLQWLGAKNIILFNIKMKYMKLWG